MSGARAFDAMRFTALADYIIGRAGLMPSEKLAIIMWQADLAAYAQQGQSITGATWMKGTWARPVWVRELGEGWFRRYLYARIPGWQRPLAWLVTGWCVVAATRSTR